MSNVQLLKWQSSIKNSIIPGKIFNKNFLITYYERDIILALREIIKDSITLKPSLFIISNISLDSFVIINFVATFHFGSMVFAWDRGTLFSFTYLGETFLPDTLGLVGG